MRYCRCSSPTPEMVEGVPVCSTCGDRVRDRLDLLRDRTIAAIAGGVTNIERQLGNAITPTPRLALTREEAARALGVGLTTFKTKIAPELRVVREGACRLYSIRELERWLADKAEPPMASQVGES